MILYPKNVSSHVSFRFFPQIDLDDLPSDTIPFSHFTFIFTTRLRQFFERVFKNVFHYQQWTIAEPSLARNGRRGIAMGSPWPSMGHLGMSRQLHWSLSTGTFRPRFQLPLVPPQLRGNVVLKALQTFVEKFFD